MSSDDHQALIRGLVQAMSDDGEEPTALATTDAVDAIQAQLTENTGRHLLDSGSAYGRHWEENQDNPPWEQARYDIQRGIVAQNVYHFMEQKFGRDRECVALEAALYAFAYSDEYESDAWLTCQEAFAEAMLGQEFSRPRLRALGLPDEFIEDVLGVQHDTATSRGESSVFTCNTYNHEFAGLSQVLQGTNIGGPYAEYVLLQVHQGCDVRGGYTGPRVYSVWDAWIPGEFWFTCENCDWDEAESCAYDAENLIYQPDIAPGELAERGLIEEGDDEHPALQHAYEANEEGHYDGALFHACHDGDELGYVRVG